jgi:hypothetical protein
MYRLTGQDAMAAVVAGQAIWNTMVGLDSSDVADLCTADSRDPDSVYHHLDSALGAVIRLLGMNEDEARDMLTSTHSVRAVYNEIMEEIL